MYVENGVEWLTIGEAAKLAELSKTRISDLYERFPSESVQTMTRTNTRRGVERESFLAWVRLRSNKRDYARKRAE